MSFAAFSMHFMLGQNTPKLYHDMTIDWEWLKGRKCIFGCTVFLTYTCYSGVSNKRSPMLINFEKFFQGLRSFLQGVRLLVLTKVFFQEGLL